MDAANVPLVREAGREPAPDVPEITGETTAPEAAADEADGATPPFLEFLDAREKEPRK